MLGTALASLVSMPLVGAAIARYGSRRVCIFTSLAACASLVIPFYAPTYAAFCAAAIAIGAAYSGFDVTINAQAVAVEATADRPIMSSFHALFSFGGLIGSAFSALLIARDMPIPIDGTCVGVLCLGCVLVAVPRLVPDRATGGPERARPAVAGPRRAVALLGALAFLGLIGEGAMADWSGVYLRSSLAVAAAGSAAGFGAFSLAMALGRASGDRFVASLGPRRTLAGGAALAAASLGAALAMHTAWAAYLGFVCVGLGLANVIPILFSAAGRAPGLAPGVGIALISTVGYGGFVIGPPLIGFTSDALGIRLALGLVVAALLAIALLTRVALPPAAGSGV